MNFEAFGSSPDFTTPIQQFLFNNCSKIEEAKKNGEFVIVDNNEKILPFKLIIIKVCENENEN